ncbi:hypothetical protein [Acinetobacter sp. ANC 5414]|uniref:hypothetical protein n=1 Tax=Acinetobacter sp. ANC 5414 TaxID=2731251 RepID=UPI00148FD4D1|nr:hypothetical protein [Acinetobacter sp. ANC 5414]NNH01499.1 hypothetical protein [Acinetobacter sp. ANC 5414]
MAKYCIKMEGKFLAYCDLLNYLYSWDASNLDQTLGKSWYWANDDLLAKQFADQIKANSFLHMKQGQFSMSGLMS